MSSGIFGTATSGLLAFQRALSTTGHNIANVNTPGFSRQRVEVVTQTPQASGAGFIGSGVKVSTITRLYDQFLVERVRASTSSSNNLDIYSQYAGRVADVLGDAKVGLNGALESFFNSVQTLANDPTSVPARQLVLSDADSLVERFHYLDDQLDTTRAEVNDQLGSLVGEVNTLSQSIADINKEIAAAIGHGGGQPPNDLLDTRDQMLEQLSGLVAVTRLEQDDGAVNVFIGNGQSLVTGFTAATLSVQGSAYNATEKDIMYSVGAVSSPITNNISGGKLGGLLNFRSEMLDTAQNALGRISAVLGTEFNLQHALGVDLDGNLGGDFFSLGTPQVSAHNGNTGTGTVAASFDTTTIGALTIQDYIISYDGAAWNLTDVDGNAVTMTGLGTVGSPFNADGLNIVVGGVPVAGDRYMIRPTRDGGEDVGLAIGSVRAIAAAAPVHITEATNANGLPTNGGTGQLAYTSVDTGFTALAGNITFTFDTALNQLSYTDGGAVNGTLAYNPATDSGTSFNVAGVNFTVTGTPANGDVFVLGNNTSGIGDNANALLLAGLQTGLTVENGTTNFQGAYAQLISDMGTKTRQAEVGGTAQKALLRQAREDRDALSGVNLDEEAANMMRFQQAYQAMAQMVTVADEMFQTLLSAVRR
ncbi:MAG: flagellar hook-associated protein FlgK [Gammaproteobacteria bacterium]|nr:flagellar hook-associated protein FlgK [Gammaproteobacteria bacterium]